MFDFGKRENDGFLDGLARYVKDLAVLAAVLYVIHWVIKDFFTAIITFNIKKLTIYGLIICFMYLMAFVGKKQREDFKSSPEETYQIDYLGV